MRRLLDDDLAGPHVVRQEGRQVRHRSGRQEKRVVLARQARREALELVHRWIVAAGRIAEWQLADNAWIQVTVNPDVAGKATVVVGVKDIDLQRSTCAAGDVAVGDVNDYGFIKTAEAVDPAGNNILFVQEVPQ